MYIKFVLLLCTSGYISTYHIQKETFWLCFDIFETSPKAQNVTLLCSDGDMDILAVDYLRPLQLGDSVCTNLTYDYGACCQSWRADHVKCIVHADETLYKERCEHQSECSVLLEPINMYTDCQSTCSDGLTDAVCWSRGVLVTYVCYNIDFVASPDNETSEMVNCNCSDTQNITSSLPQRRELGRIEWVIILVAVTSVCLAVGVTIGWLCARLCLHCEKKRYLYQKSQGLQSNVTAVEVNQNKCQDNTDDIQHGTDNIPNCEDDIGACRF